MQQINFTKQNSRCANIFINKILILHNRTINWDKCLEESSGYTTDCDPV